MKKFSTAVVLLLAITACKAQKNADPFFSVQEVTRIETVLSADDMQGRRAGTPGSDKAADFIAAEFKKAGLQPLQGESFIQRFSMVTPKLTLLKLELNDQDVDAKRAIVITTQPDLKVNEKSGYETATITEGNLNAQAQKFMAAAKNMVVFVDSSFAPNFGRLTNFKRGLFASKNSVVFILGSPVTKFTVKAEHTIEEMKFANVVGVLPGHSKKGEQVVFSGHYDHLGIARKNDGVDSIYNGANDDAAGIAAVIMLANYFKKQNNNERTLVFAAFTAEEIGGFGSRYFSMQLDPSSVAAMFNIEMIGTESKWGTNSAYITGFDQSDMGTILQNNLKGSSFVFYPDPYTSQNLFYRSDNATLARLGVPAHTISTAKMEEEPNYHKVSDEIKTLDMENMAAIIKAIAVSSRSIVSGKDTPSRINANNLR